jgi:hypothetical protein
MKHAGIGLLPVVLLAACDKQPPQHADGLEPVVKASKSPASRHLESPRDDNESPPPDPRQILAAALESAEPAPRAQAVAEVAWNTLEIDPAVAAEALSALDGESPDRLRLIQHFAMRRAEQDPAAALEWADGLDSEKEVAAAKCQIALVLAESDPERAANLLSESGIEGRELEVATVEVLQRWAANTPSGAAAWVATFPAGPTREAGLRVLVAAWMKLNAAMAMSWMSSLRDDAVRKEAAVAMAETLLQQPESIREQWLTHADAKVRVEIDAERDHAMKNVGANVPASPK